ncbi:hypothetical protein [Nocardia australiensis]|uniref:hypothetical protein n=1 Tax=Nocardia australiensis TaxID=2887191 RepID=UPI001D13B359|nr:hypothetical protein [Nocardia australiensis]
MIIRKLVATAIMAIAASGIAAVTAHGEAGLAGPSVNGVDGPIAYTAALAPDHSSATVTLASGKFSLTPDAVTVLADDGAVVGAIPTTMRMQTGQALEVTPVLNTESDELTLTPVGGPAPGVVNSPESIALQAIGDAGTTVAGVLIGCAIGVLIGVWFILVGAIVGCVIGGIIGGVAGANQ